MLEVFRKSKKDIRMKNVKYKQAASKEIHMCVDPKKFILIVKFNHGG